MKENKNKLPPVSTSSSPTKNSSAAPQVNITWDKTMDKNIKNVEQPPEITEDDINLVYNKLDNGEKEGDIILFEKRRLRCGGSVWRFFALFCLDGLFAGSIFKPFFARLTIFIQQKFTHLLNRWWLNLP